jgi:hypothetical protein
MKVIHKTLIFGFIMEAIIYTCLVFVYQNDPVYLRLLVSGIISLPLCFLSSVIFFFVMDGREREEEIRNEIQQKEKEGETQRLIQEKV